MQADRLRLVLFVLIGIAGAGILSATVTRSNALGWASAATFVGAVCVYVLWRIAVQREV